jgi:mannosyl-3-phosphoglycerate phosphatase
VKLVVFSDLDGTLLDPASYSWRPAEEALAALKAKEAALILVSSKTLAEIEPLHRQLGLQDPFIFENGGGIVAHRSSDSGEYLASRHQKTIESGDGSSLVFPLGEKYDDLVLALAEISDELGVKLVGFSSMSNSEIQDLTGLHLQDAVKARMRLFDEPFLLPPESLDRLDELSAAAKRRGLQVVSGGRFLHLIGHSGKGEAVSILVAAFRQLCGEIITIGLGDSPNDFPFLQLMQIPILLGEPGQHQGLPESLKDLRRIEKPGPAGWNRAVLDVLSGLLMEETHSVPGR